MFYGINSFAIVKVKEDAEVNLYTSRDFSGDDKEDQALKHSWFADETSFQNPRIDIRRRIHWRTVEHLESMPQLVRKTGRALKQESTPPPAPVPTPRTLPHA